MKPAALILGIAFSSNAFTLPISIVQTSTGLLSFDTGIGADANLALYYNDVALNSEFTSVAPVSILSPGVYTYDITLSGGDVNPSNPPLAVSDFTHFIIMFDSPAGSYSLLTGPVSIGSSAFSMHPAFNGFVYDNLRYELTSLLIGPRSLDTIGWFAFTPDGVGDFHGEFSISVTAIPEPASFGLLCGVAALVTYQSRRKRG